MKSQFGLVNLKSSNKPLLYATLQEISKQAISADVTLVSDDQIPVEAHKMFLSAISPTLKGLFLKNPHPHPLIFLRGVNFQDLQDILHFIHFGEVIIGKERIEKFMKVAGELQIDVFIRDKQVSKQNPDEKGNNLKEKAKAEILNGKLKPNFLSLHSEIDYSNDQVVKKK